MTVTDPTQLIEIRAKAIYRLIDIASNPGMSTKERLAQIEASLLLWLEA